MNKKEKAEMESLRAQLKAQKTTKSTKSVSGVCPDGFYTLVRLESETGKDLRVQAIAKDNKITGYFLANLFSGYDGRAKGAHISQEMYARVTSAIENADITKLS